MSKIYQKTHPAGKNAGFTLIELLVMAVMKSRLSTMRTVLENLHRAEEVFYMANGYYEANTDKLDFDYKGSCTGTDVLKCGNFFYVDIINGSGVVTDPGKLHIKASYCVDTETLSECSPDFSYYVWFDNSSNPGLRTCIGNNEKGRKFCNIINAEN